MESSNAADNIMVMLLSSNEKYCVLIRQIAAKFHWILLEPAGWQDAQETLAAVRVPVVICERSRADGNWKLIVQLAEDLQRETRFIVFHPEDERWLFVEALGRGAWDVIKTPFDHDEVRRVVTLAAASRSRVQGEDRRAQERTPPRRAHRTAERAAGRG